MTPSDLSRLEGLIATWENAAPHAGASLMGELFREAQAGIWDNRTELLALARRAMELTEAWNGPGGESDWLEFCQDFDWTSTAKGEANV